MTFSADKSPDRIAEGKSLEPIGTSKGTPTKNFQSHMQAAPGTPKGAEPQGISPMEMAQGRMGVNEVPSLNTILGQAGAARDSLGTVEKQLKTPGLKLRRSQTHLLKNKLTDAGGYIRQAAGKMGVEKESMQMPSGASALGRFIAYVNDGQDQLVQVQQKLKEMSSTGHQMSAAEMLSVTVKMNLAQQEIEYASNLLAKVISSIKTIMETQL